VADFSYLSSSEVTRDSTAELTLYDVRLPGGGHPTLIGRYAGETNRAYFTPQLEAAMRRQRRARKGQVDVEVLGQLRALDRKLYPQHVLTGWRDVCDADGKAVPFSAAACGDFIAALPWHIFDDVRSFFGDLANFRPDALSDDEAVEVGKS
jgi:hypothetical protein